jgi:hypothetical protein
MSQPLHCSQSQPVSARIEFLAWKASIERQHRILGIKLRFKAKNIQNENLSC